MGGMEFNKIFAAVLVAGIVAMLSGFVSKKLISAEMLEEDVFKVEVAESGGAGATAKAAGAQPILEMIAAADISRGEKIAKACAACHTFTKGGANGVGPNMWGVVSGPKNHVAGFSYSGALEKSGGNKWTYLELNKFLWKPSAYAPGTKMSYAGLKKAEDRAALLAWMRMQADSPAPLPTEAEIAAEKAELAPEEPVASAAPAEAGTDSAASAPSENPM